MIHRFSRFKTHVQRAAVFGAGCWLFAFYASNAISLAAPAKKVAPIKSLMLSGSGVCTLQATFVRGSSNISGRPFTSIGRDERFKNIVSSSRAMESNGYSVVVNFIGGRGEGDLGPPRPIRDENKPESPEQKERRLRRPTGIFTLALASPGGFRKGQTISVIAPVYSSKPRPANVIFSYSDEVRIQQRDVFDGNGQRKRTYRDVNREWLAVSGTLRVESVNSEKITFSLKNVRFVVPEANKDRNGAQGAFILNGIGQSTFNEVD